MSPTWRKAASVVLFCPIVADLEADYDYRICFVVRSPESRIFPNGYVFPGGTIENIDGESLKACAIREVMEETGILLGHPVQFVDRNYRSEFIPVPGSHSLEPLSLWISPEEIASSGKGGFETHFFVSFLADDTAIRLASADASEISAIEWLTPSQALSPGIKFKLPMPQLYMISEISACRRFQDLNIFIRRLNQGIFKYPFKPLRKTYSDQSFAFVLPGDSDHPEFTPLNGQRWEHRGIYAHSHANSPKNPSWSLIRSTELRDEAERASKDNRDWCHRISLSRICFAFSVVVYGRSNTKNLIKIYLLWSKVYTESSTMRTQRSDRTHCALSNRLFHHSSYLRAQISSS